MFSSMKIVGFWYSFSVEVNEGKTVTTVKMGLKKFVKLISYGVWCKRLHLVIFHIGGLCTTGEFMSVCLSACVLWGLVTGECLEICNCLVTFGRTSVSWFFCSIPDIDPEYIVLYLLVNYVTLIVHKHLWYLFDQNCVSWAVFSCSSGHLSIFFTWNCQNYISKIWFQSKDSYCFWQTLDQIQNHGKWRKIY